MSTRPRPIPATEPEGCLACFSLHSQPATSLCLIPLQRFHPSLTLVSYLTLSLYLGDHSLLCVCVCACLSVCVCVCVVMVSASSLYISEIW